jgi:hypothetical protein
MTTNRKNYFCNECKNGGCLIEADLNDPDDYWLFSDSGCDVIQGGFTKRPLWVPEITKKSDTIGDGNYVIAVVRKEKSKPLRKKIYCWDDV